MHEIRPGQGMLVLIPTFFYDNTISFESAEPRIGIAFDAVSGFSQIPWGASPRGPGSSRCHFVT